MKGSPSQNFAPSSDLFKQTLDEAFPKVDPGHRPLGTKVLVQVRVAKQTTESGLVLVREAQETIAANTLVAKVVALGPMVFKNVRTGEAWPEGPWFKEGDYVRCPRYGGDQWEVPVGNKNDDVVMFRLFDHLQFSAVVDDPTKVIAYV